LSGSSARATGEVEHRPVFILGSPRSGTTAIMQALANSSEYTAFPEGHVFDILARFDDTIADFYKQKNRYHVPDKSNRRIMLDVIDREYMQQLIWQVLRQIADDVFPTGLWLDKTPGTDTIALAPTFREIWPQSRFIFMKRRGIDNVLSRLRKFRYESAWTPTFLEHCEDWAGTMSLWRRVRAQLDGCYIEVDQYEMAVRPAMIARKIGDFLGLDAPAMRSLGGLLKEIRPEKTVASEEVLALEDTGWSTENIETFRSVCEPVMAAFGYSLGKSYFSSAPER
jgi:hypothetical protein